MKKRVDIEYLEYLRQGSLAGETQLTARLSFHKRICEEMFEGSSEEAKEKVRKQVKENTLDMPDYLLEVQETLGEEETMRYFRNHRWQT